jgi:transcriptional regulator with XRE-family HTH domain
MTTPDMLFKALRQAMQGKTTKDIAKASGVDVLAVRKVRNDVNTGSLKIGTLRKLVEGLRAMNGEADND